MVCLKAKQILRNWIINMLLHSVIVTVQNPARNDGSNTIQAQAVHTAGD
jgi:hypothetical protein